MRTNEIINYNTNLIIIPSLSNFRIRDIARAVYERLEIDKHPLVSHIWGDNYSIHQREPNHHKIWYPISILPNRRSKPEKEFIIGYDIGRRGARMRVSGLYLSIVFSKYENQVNYFEEFKSLYLDDDMRRKNYKDAYFEVPRITLKLKEHIKYNEIANDEIECIYHSIKSMYSDWQPKILKFLDDYKILDNV